MHAAGLVLIVFGAGIAVFSHPKVGGPILARLMNEGLLTSRIARPEKTETIRYAGPHLSLFVAGVVIIFLGILLFLL